MGSDLEITLIDNYAQNKLARVEKENAELRDSALQWNESARKLGDLIGDQENEIDALKQELAELKAANDKPTTHQPGTWAWACETMLEGQSVTRGGGAVDYVMRGGGAPVICMESKINDACEVAVIDSLALNATDWRVAQ